MDLIGENSSLGKWYLIRPEPVLDTLKDVSKCKLSLTSTLLILCFFTQLSGCLLEYELNDEDNSEIDSDSENENFFGTVDYKDYDSDSSEGLDSAADNDSVGGGETSTDTGLDKEPDASDEVDPNSCPGGFDFNSNTAFTQPIVGKSAERYKYHDACEDGEIIVGYRGYFRTGSNNNLIHGKIQALCALMSFRFEGGKCLVKTGEPSSLPLRGNTGAIEWTRICPQDQVIVGYDGRAGSDIDQITLFCAPLHISASDNGYTMRRGEISPLQRAGGVGGNYDYEDECPESYVATSSTMSASEIDVNAFGLGCQQLEFAP